jgi:beta-glucosidase-like glycosyl hydrolase
MVRNKSYLYLLFLLSLFTFNSGALCSQIGKIQELPNPGTVDEVIERMTIREKIAQLFIVSFSSDYNNKSTKEAIDLIHKERVGGVIIMSSSLTPGVKMINYLQSLSKIPLLVTIDGEWGAAMRFDSIVPFPRQMQLGALSSDHLVFKMGYAIGEQCRRLGIDVNYAPTIDINNNPRNPVINTRSFGEDPMKVAQFGRAYMRGMQEAGVLGSAKHFPGHGDTEIDSHLDLPLLPFSRSRIDSLELYPFRVLIEAGVDMVMAGHLQIPSLDNSGRPSSISKAVITDLLRNELEFNGLIVSDALNMKGVANFMAPELLPLEAYKAGYDIILMPERVSEAISVIERAVYSGEISLHSLNMRCRKVLTYKMRLGILERREPVSLNNLYEDLNKREYQSLISQISEQTLTLIQNKDNNLPIKDLVNNSIGYLSLGGDKNGKELATYLSYYGDVDTIILRGRYRPEHLSGALRSLSDKSHIIVALHNTDARPQREFGIDMSEIEKLSTFAMGKRVTLIYFGNPLAIPFIVNHHNFKSFIIAYSNTPSNNLAAAQIIFGASGSKGRLPVSAGVFSLGHGIDSEDGVRIAYIGGPDTPFDSELLERRADSLIGRDIKNLFYQGAQLMVIHRDRVVIHKSYGNLNNNSTVRLNRISGMISLLPAVIKLSTTGGLSLEDFAGAHLSLKRGSPYSKALISDLLIHRFSTGESRGILPEYSRENISVLMRITEKITNLPFDAYIKHELYDKAGMNKSNSTKEETYSNANDIAKFISLLKRGGMYGGVEVLDRATSVNSESLLHYYSSTLNGGVIWSDNEKDITLIFLNNGDERGIDERSRNLTGDLLRRALIDLCKNER